MAYLRGQLGPAPLLNGGTLTAHDKDWIFYWTACEAHTRWRARDGSRAPRKLTVHGPVQYLELAWAMAWRCINSSPPSSYDRGNNNGKGNNGNNGIAEVASGKGGHGDQADNA